MGTVPRGIRGFRSARLVWFRFSSFGFLLTTRRPGVRLRGLGDSARGRRRYAFWDASFEAVVVVVWSVQITVHQHSNDIQRTSCPPRNQATSQAKAVASAGSANRSLAA